MNGITIAERVDIVKAKRIHVFENGNSESFGQELLINSTRERTWNKVLTHLTQVLKPSYGIVRHLITIDGKESVHSFTELNSGARYVACGKEQYKKVSGGYRTLLEYNHSKKKKCAQLYPKQEKKDEEDAETDEHWALRQAQKNKRTVIYVFSNGLKHQAPVKFVLIDDDLLNWPRTLNHISYKLDKPEGIRYFYTVYGRKVCAPCEIQHGACYVATAFGEKYEKLSYMDSYQDLVLFKRKSGETMKQFNIGAISSPMGLEIRNNDCFFSKYAGADKKHVHKAKKKEQQRPEKGKPTRKRKGKKRSSSTSSKKSSEKRLSNESRRISLPEIQQNEEDEYDREGDDEEHDEEEASLTSHDSHEMQEITTKRSSPTSSKKSSEKRLSNESRRISLPKVDQTEEDEYDGEGDDEEHDQGEELQKDKLSTITEASVSSHDSNEIQEITIEEIGTKFVAVGDVETSSQITQTDDNKPTNRGKKLMVNVTSDGGLRIIGADEIAKRKLSNTSIKSALSPEEEVRLINEHRKKIKERLSQLSQGTDPEIVDSRESAISFTYCYLNSAQMLNLASIDNNSKLKYQKTIVAFPVNTDDISVAESKSVAIIENPVIIPNDSSSTDNLQTINKKSIPIIQRRSTGFHMNFGPNFVTNDSDDDDDDDNEDASNQKTEEFKDGNTQLDPPKEITQTRTINTSTNVENKDVSSQKTEEFTDKNTQVDSQTKTRTRTNNTSTNVENKDASNQKTEEFKDENTQIDSPKDTKSTRTMNTSTNVGNKDADTQESEPLTEEKAGQSVINESVFTEADYDEKERFLTTYQDSYKSLSEQLREQPTQKDFPTKVKYLNSGNTTTVPGKDASNQKQQELNEMSTQKDLPHEIKTTDTSSTSTDISDEDASTQDSGHSSQEKRKQGAINDTYKDKETQKTRNIIVGMVQTQPVPKTSCASTTCSTVDKEIVADTRKKQEQQITQCLNTPSSEYETTEEKRIAIASEVQQLLQKGDRNVGHPIPCNKKKNISPKIVENEINTFERAHETGVIKDTFCVCGFPLDAAIEQHIDANLETELSQSLLEKEIQPPWSSSCPTDDTICCSNVGLISKETQTESNHFLPTNIEQKSSRLRYYVLKTGTYNEFFEMPYDASQIDATREFLRHKRKRKFSLCKCFNFFK